MQNGGKKTKKINKMLAPVIITLAVLILVFSFIIFLIWLRAESRFPVWLLIVLLISPAAIVAGTVAALCSRFKEIKGGEEDEASKY